MKRHGLASQVIWQTTERFQLRLLHDVGNVDTGTHALAIPQIHHLPNKTSMTRQQLVKGRSTPRADLLQQLGGLFRIGLDLHLERSSKLCEKNGFKTPH